jgi:hypothetical protein
MKPQPFEDFLKLPKLKKYSEVPPGFEIVSGQFRSNPYELTSTLNLDREEAAVSLWNNTGMPAEDLWDDDINKLQEVQSGLGDLSDHTRFLRAMIASYDILHYQYVKSSEFIIERLGLGEYKPELPVGWFVTWWPPNQTKRIDMLEVYIEFLKAWEQKQKSLTIRTSKQYKNEVLRNVYARLGEWSSRKRNYVVLFIEKLESFLNTFHFPQAYYNSMEIGRYNMLLKSKMDQLIGPIEHETKISRADDKLILRIEDYTEPIFFHGFFDEVDLWLDHIGKGSNAEFVQSRDRSDREALKASSELLHALGDFLEHHLSGSEQKVKSDIAAFLNEHIPEPSKEQLWLISCLWKTVREQLIINSNERDFIIKIDDRKNWLSKL